jgi:primary-amine oxidase
MNVNDARAVVKLLIFFMIKFSLFAMFLSVSSFAQHPLEPLTADETSVAVATVKTAKSLPDGVMFPSVVLKEPPKTEVLSWKPGAPFRREAAVVVYDRKANTMAEATVNLATKSLISWTPRPGAQPNVMLSEFSDYPDDVRKDERWRAAMTKRGLNPDKLWVDLWAAGPMSAAEKKTGHRLLRGLAYLSEGNKNPYAHPVEGVVAIFDANTRKVIDVVDSGVVPVATAKGDFDSASVPPARAGLKPLVTSQPDGPSFTLNGHEVRWQNWVFHFTLHPREGPVLYQVSYQDGAKLRPILYRASLSDMLVPYGDADPNWSFRNAFDEGEYGIGRMAGPIDPKTDVPANATFVDADFADDLGKPYKVEKAMALYERDGGISWKHLDTYVSNQNQARRSRELVLCFIATISNYDYQISWVFRQDGSIAMDAALTGIMLAKGVVAQNHMEAHHDPMSAYGHLVAPGVLAPHHQHFFNFRLDFDVDGTDNRVLEAETKSAPAGKDNPLGNAILMTERPLTHELAAQRDMNMATARKWIVVSASAKNSLGGPTGYALLPAENSVPYLLPSSPVRQKGRFVDHHLWVTRESDDEMYAAGPYPNQGQPGQGLPAWTKADRNIDGKDLVLWYTFGMTHVPRPEDWPVMPTYRIGFQLVPVGFFDRNPALDLPQ